MILIVGGCAAGKRAFAQEKFGLPADGWCDGAEADWQAFAQAQQCCNLQAMVYRLLAGEAEPEGEATAELLAAALSAEPAADRRERIVTADEIGCGIVPMGALERRWREETGRVCCALAREAREVWRVCCGLGYRLK